MHLSMPLRIALKLELVYGNFFIGGGGMKTTLVKICANDRLIAWLTPNILAHNDALLEKLKSLYEEYDQSNHLTIGDVDRIFAESDKIQAELFRRIIAKGIK